MYQEIICTISVFIYIYLLLDHTNHQENQSERGFGVLELKRVIAILPALY